MPSPERRKHPRVAESVSCQVGWASRWASTRTINLSCGGVLCALTEPIPVMTKCAIRLEIPGPSSGRGSSPRQIRCVGVVVRQERSKVEQDPAPYRIAIYFSDLKPEDHRHLGEFILRSMLKHDHRSPERD